MCRKHEHNVSNPNSRRARRTKDMIDTGRRFLLDYVWIPPYAMRCSSFFQTALLFVRQTKKKVSLRPASDCFQGICRRQRQIVQPFLSSS